MEQRLVNPLLRKVVSIVAIVLILQIPTLQISELATERHQRKKTATAELAVSAGGPQFVVGPILAVPVESIAGKNGGNAALAYVLPDSLTVTGAVQTEERARGIFRIPIHRSDLTFKVSFSPAAFRALENSPEHLRWDQAVLALGISDPHTLGGDASLRSDGKEYRLEPARRAGPLFQRGIQAEVGAAFREGFASREFELSIRFTGTERLSFLGLGERTVVELSGNWPSPSFIGSLLPTTRTVGSGGFTARWESSQFGRELSQVIVRANADSAVDLALEKSSFGVDFFEPVDVHALSDRAIKYELFIVSLTFLVYALVEILRKVRVHEIQYTLVGAALVLFYLLLLSLSEHLTFGIAYLAAAAISAGLIVGYSRAIIGSWKPSIGLGGLLASLYGYFYFLLREEDYALVYGALGLTAMLAATMYLTRKIDWYSVHASRPKADVIRESTPG